MSELEMESDSSSGSLDKSKKTRKRTRVEPEQEELEIDVNLPEPPSKKARRKEKQGKSKKVAVTDDTANDAGPAESDDATDAKATAPKRSEYGIWVGNLSFSATPDKLREFLQDKGDIDNNEIVRLNMPGPAGQKKEKGVNGRTEVDPRAPQNKGFAYVDFTTKEVQEKAIALSETLFVGRKVLIKDAKSFAGRPQVEKGENGAGGKGNGKEPSKRVFIGNLGFDVTKEDITELLGKAGTIEDCFLASFEDTGKCKGFGWVRFNDIEAAQAAVRGFFHEEKTEGDDEEQDGSEEEGASSKKKRNRRRKIWVNQLHGRALRCEFAEDAQTRYKKRFGKDKPKTGSRGAGFDQDGGAADTTGSYKAPKEHSRPQRRDRSGDADQRREDRRKRHDARTIAPGKALSATPRASAAIVQGAGKKTSFD